MTEKKAKEADEETNREVKVEPRGRKAKSKGKPKKGKPKQGKGEKKVEKLMSKEEAKELAREMLRSGMGISKVIEKTGLPGKSVSGLQSYLIKEEKIRRLLREGKSIEEIKKDVKIPKPIIRSIARAEHIEPPEKAQVPEPEEDENTLSVKFDDEERELFEKGKNTMLAFQDAGIIPKKLRDESDAEFIRLASLSLANAMTTVRERIRGGK